MPRDGSAFNKSSTEISSLSMHSASYFKNCSESLRSLPENFKLQLFRYFTTTNFVVDEDLPLELQMVHVALGF